MIGIEKAVVVIVLLGLIVGAGCAAMEKAGWTPEGIGAAGQKISEAGKELPAPTGSVLSLIGLGLAGVAGGYAEYQRRKGNKALKAFMSTAAGIEKFEAVGGQEALEELKRLLFKEQAKAGVVQVVDQLRNGKK